MRADAGLRPGSEPSNAVVYTLVLVPSRVLFSWEGGDTPHTSSDAKNFEVHVSGAVEVESIRGAEGGSKRSWRSGLAGNRPNLTIPHVVRELGTLDLTQSRQRVDRPPVGALNMEAEFRLGATDHPFRANLAALGISKEMMR